MHKDGVEPWRCPLSCMRRSLALSNCAKLALVRVLALRRRIKVLEVGSRVDSKEGVIAVFLDGNASDGLAYPASADSKDFHCPVVPRCLAPLIWNLCVCNFLVGICYRRYFLFHGQCTSLGYLVMMDSCNQIFVLVVVDKAHVTCHLRPSRWKCDVCFGAYF